MLVLLSLNEKSLVDLDQFSLYLPILCIGVNQCHHFLDELSLVVKAAVDVLQSDLHGNNILCELGHLVGDCLDSRVLIALHPCNSEEQLAVKELRWPCLLVPFNVVKGLVDYCLVVRAC